MDKILVRVTLEMRLLGVINSVLSQNDISERNMTLYFFIQKTTLMFLIGKVLQEDYLIQRLIKYRLFDKDGRLYRLQGRGIKGSPINLQKMLTLNGRKQIPN
jgi:hypothetical protein